jgi:5-(carboxyamino)imidazole ribonucleotide synthase
MEFDERLNAVSLIVSPGVLEPAEQTTCLQIALDAVGALGAIGVFAVELFISASGEFFINEISPRVHNSGHLTMDGFQHDQFEQHIRAVSGRSIGPIVPRAPAAVMLNLLYEENLSNAHTGAPYSVALDDDHMTFVHWYGKKEAREGRKMGHINAMGHSRDEALARARAGLKVLCSEAFNPSVDLYKAVKR